MWNSLLGKLTGWKSSQEHQEELDGELRTESPVQNQYHTEIIDKWRTTDSSNYEYFSLAEADSWVGAFWSEHGRYKPFFDKLDTRCVVEIACGHGRHSARIVDLCERLFLIDSSIDAVAYAAKRFKDRAHVTVLHAADGASLPGIPAESANAVFTYDAMVHFELLTVAKYIIETARVLRPGGRGLFHHSNYSGNPTGRVDENPGWRNFMTVDVMAHLLSRSGLQIIEQLVFDRDSPAGDALTLFEKR